MSASDASRARGGFGDHPAAAPLAFTLFLLLGCGYIVSAKLWDLRPALVTFVPVLCMVAYALAMLFLGGLRMRDDQAGDNVYYMGFLYTLTSLGVSLYQFTSSNSGEGIVQNFGIAIASTIAGVAGRVLFNQMRRDPAEIERQSRLELAEASRKVKRELDSTVVEMAYFRRQMAQMVQEGLQETQEKFGVAWHGVREGMEQATARTVEAMDAHAAAVRGQGDALKAAQSRAVDALTDLRSRLDAARLPTEAVKPVTEALERAAAEMSRAMEAGSGLVPRVQAQVAGLAAEVRRLEEARAPGEPDNVRALRTAVDGNAA